MIIIFPIIFLYNLNTTKFVIKFNNFFIIWQNFIYEYCVQCIYAVSQPRHKFSLAELVILVSVAMNIGLSS